MADSSSDKRERLLREACDALGKFLTGGNSLEGTRRIIREIRELPAPPSATSEPEGYPGIAHDFETMRAKLAELCDRLDWKGPSREANISITVSEARALLASASSHAGTPPQSSERAVAEELEDIAESLADAASFGAMLKNWGEIVLKNATRICSLAATLPQPEEKKP